MLINTLNESKVWTKSRLQNLFKNDSDRKQLLAFYYPVKQQTPPPCLFGYKRIIVIYYYPKVLPKRYHLSGNTIGFRRQI